MTMNKIRGKTLAYLSLGLILLGVLLIALISLLADIYEGSEQLKETDREMAQLDEELEYARHIDKAMDMFLSCTQLYEDKLNEYARNPIIAEDAQWIDLMKQHEYCMSIAIVGMVDYEDVPDNRKSYHEGLSVALMNFREVIPASTIMLEYNEEKFGLLTGRYAYCLQHLYDFFDSL